jgi:hypothetical protein
MSKPDGLAPASQIKPFLTHDDAWVRTAVAEYFEWSESDPDIGGLLVEAVRTHGVAANALPLRLLETARFSDAHLDELLELAAKASETEAEFLNPALVSAPAAWVAAHAEALLKLPHLADGLRARVETKSSFADWTPERHWAHLVDLSREHSDSYVGDFDLGAANDHVRALVDAPAPASEALAKQLEDEAIEGTWLEIFIVDLLGYRRYKPAVATLVRLVDPDCGDYLPGRAAEAIARIGAVEAVPLLRKRLADADPEQCEDLFVIETLEGLKHPESAQALSSFLNRERDDMLPRTYALVARCRLFEREGVIAAIQAARRGEYDDEYEDLRAFVLPYAEILGLELREREKWTDLRRRLDEEAAKAPPPSDDEALDDAEDLGDDEDGDYDDAPPERVETFVRAEPKVGRNDPCPCGSGKKFKKCCLAGDGAGASD